MLIIPAIDLRGGRVVRLLQGDPARTLAYGDDPRQWASHWTRLGATWLHVVDLDGAFEGRPVHLELVREICALGIPVQVGGGFRTVEGMEAGLRAGAARVVVGTAALALGRAMAPFGQRVAVSLDVRGGRVAVAGWQQQTDAVAADVAAELRSLGIGRFIYTDIARDGMLGGPDLEGLGAFVRSAGVPVIAAGGVAGATDLEAIAATGVEGVIVGRALYEGRIDLRAALDRWSALPC